MSAGQNAPHGFGRHALRDLVGGEQQLHGAGGAAHHGRREGVGEQVGPGPLPEQVNEGLGANCVATWGRRHGKRVLFRISIHENSRKKKQPVHVLFKLMGSSDANSHQQEAAVLILTTPPSQPPLMFELRFNCGPSLQGSHFSTYLNKIR